MKDVELNADGKKVIAHIRPLKYGELIKIREQCIETKVIGSMPQMTVNVAKLQELVVKTVVTLSEGKLEDLPASEAVKVEEVALEEAGLTSSSFQDGGTKQQ